MRRSLYVYIVGNLVRIRRIVDRQEDCGTEVAWVRLEVVAAVVSVTKSSILGKAGQYISSYTGQRLGRDDVLGWFLFTTVTVYAHVSKARTPHRGLRRVPHSASLRGDQSRLRPLSRI